MKEILKRFSSRCDFVSCILAAFVFGWAYWNMRIELASPKVSFLDVDGWGHFLTVFNTKGFHLSLLWLEPTIWKGPVVPTLFGLVYYLFPNEHSILLFCVVCASLSAVLHYHAFRHLGLPSLPVAIGVLIAFAHPSHRHLYGYYFAEPVISLISGSVFWLVSQSVGCTSPKRGFLIGIGSGLLLLARSPFLFVVLGIGYFLYTHSYKKEFKIIIAYSVGILAITLPWCVRNMVVERAFIPFTAESGKVLFQGTYVPADDIGQSDLRKREDYREIESKEGTDLIERDRYWKSLAKQNVLHDPLGQIKLCLKKSLRFWTQIPPYSWFPSVKSLVVAVLSLPLFLVGLRRLVGRPVASLILIWTVGVWAFHSLVHSEFRYNYPLLPFVFVTCCYGLATFFQSPIESIE
jgi:hypothetical protein